jgi:hypothetical protein
MIRSLQDHQSTSVNTVVAIFTAIAIITFVAIIAIPTAAKSSPNRS